MTGGGRVRLRAEDADDLEVIGAMVQDALVPLADIAWLRDENRFVLVVNRFMWERAGETVASGESEEPAEAYSRVHGVLSVHDVRSVQVRGIDQTDREQLLNILAVTGGPDHVQIEFAGSGTIRIETGSLRCYFEDLGEPWPTRWRPDHDAKEQLADAPRPGAATAARRSGEGGE